MMESIDTQIFLAYCEYKRFTEKKNALAEMMTGQRTLPVIEFAEARKLMLEYRQLIDMWLSEGWKNVPTQH